MRLTIFFWHYVPKVVAVARDLDHLLTMTMMTRRRRASSFRDDDDDHVDDVDCRWVSVNLKKQGFII